MDVGAGAGEVGQGAAMLFEPGGDLRPRRGRKVRRGRQLLLEEAGLVLDAEQVASDVERIMSR